MLNRSQLYTLLLARKHRGNLFSPLPRDLISLIGSCSENPQSEISTLLHHIAFGSLASAKAMLDVTPRLVLQAGNVVTPSGLKVKRTTPLEFALGAGDVEMAKMIAPYFDSRKIAGGKSERAEQYARYRKHIDNMLMQTPYDYTLLVTTLKHASFADVNAALSNDRTYESALHDVLTQFRKEFTPGEINVGMHFHYQHLLHAAKVYDREFYNLQDYDKARLFARQVIGFLQRNLPAIDRMIFAQGLTRIVEYNIPIKRSFKFAYDSSEFPFTDRGYSIHSGLGFEHFIGEMGLPALCWGEVGPRATLWQGNLEKLISSKIVMLAELARPQREEKTFKCVIC
jgi:hypothetical protein